MTLKVGDTASLAKVIGNREVEQFAELVGDRNPVHVNEQFALKTRFKGRIAHGMWGAALISTVLGTHLPGPGTIYLSQTLAFKAPIRFGDTITARVTVTKVREEKAIFTLETVCENQGGERLVEGEAVVLVEDVPLPDDFAE
jgi:acyl dehydratase